MSPVSSAHPALYALHLFIGGSNEPYHAVDNAKDPTSGVASKHLVNWIRTFTPDGYWKSGRESHFEAGVMKVIGEEYKIYCKFNVA